MQKIKVVWLCDYTNSEYRKYLNLNDGTYSDYSVFNTVRCRYMEKYLDLIDLHIVTLHEGMKDDRIDFSIRCVNYHVVKKPSTLWFRLRRKFLNYRYWCYNKTKELVNIINEINPSLLVCIGIEGYDYSLAALKIAEETPYPVVMAMQTCFSDPDFKKNYPITTKYYNYFCDIEQRFFKASNYLASGVDWYRKIAMKYNNNLIPVCFYFNLLNDYLTVDKYVEKKYDFVYFSRFLIKAGDDALKAFVEASKQRPGISLQMIGRCSQDEKKEYERIIKENNLEGKVVFYDYFPNYDDALQQVCRAKYALLPLKIDILSGTLMEAFSLEIPVLTYETHGTPSMNRDMECILISPNGDYIDLAKNMIKLIDNPDLAKSLANNAKKEAQKRWAPEESMNREKEMYIAIYNHFYNGVNIPDNVGINYI